MPTLALAVIREADVPRTDRWFHRIGRAALGVVQRERPQAIAASARRLEVSLLLAGDRALRRLNREYRGLDRPTDVLSFAQLEGAAAPTGRSLHLGDVAISVERARRQAVAYGHSLDRELAYLWVHGLLHLAGYDHEVDGDQEEMRRAEEAALGLAGLTRERFPGEVSDEVRRQRAG